MTRANIARLLLPAFVVAGLALAQEAQVTPESIMVNNDLNKDGVVTREEAIQAGRVLGQSWETYDVNKDGKVDMEELKRVRAGARPAQGGSPLSAAVSAAASPELCRHGFSCATDLWRQETLELTPKAGGAPYVIQVSIPAEPAPAAGYAVVYLMDAGTTFGTLADIAHYQELFFTPTVVVGVRYRDPFEVDRRGDDLTPPGSGPFLAFLVQDVRSELAKRVKVDATRQALFGHSLSGLFVLTTLFTQPEAFDTYVAADPAIHMGGYRLIQRWPELQGRKFPDRSRHLLLLHGSLPEGPEVDRFAKRAGIPLPPTPAPVKPAPPNPYVKTQSEFAQMMQSIDGVETTFVAFPGETHQSMIPAYLGRGLRWTLMGWDPP